ncbi:MAG: DUF3110 domain-containing protein [Cyanophyceae cyanobacterium]
MQVFVLLFNAQTENEGIHTVQSGEHNKVLMFESEDDATRFALLLEAQDFPTPTVEAIDSKDVEEFCLGAGYECELIREGMLVIPPEANVEKTDCSTEADAQTAEATVDESELSNEQLEQIRRQLEGLL